MASSGDTLTTPGGTSFLIIESTPESGGKRIEFEVTMPPDAPAPPKHFHPRQEESWHVLEGELSVLVRDEWRTLREDESLSLPPNTVHTLRNRSAQRVRFRNAHEPALNFQQYIEALDRLTAAGKLTSRRNLSTLLHGALVLRQHRTTQLSASAAQRAAENVLALVARTLGYDNG
jgi:quercetin dioxygenase-like cupin family protein